MYSVGRKYYHRTIGNHRPCRRHVSLRPAKRKKPKLRPLILNDATFEALHQTVSETRRRAGP
jgi:hypothetical protein